ncbi:hypothetical protein DIPPA_17872 [Diplonema papillatum]|nr:hypothetical protein DIPPA_17872 [Diplonema papillatum]
MQLGLEELLEEIAGTIDEAFAAEAERLGVRVDELVLVRPKSQHGPQKKKRCFAFMLLTDLSSQQAAYSAHDLKALLAFCLANTYVLVNGILMRQILGIPMGANASPDIANLFCYAKEKRYMMRLLAERDIRRATLLSMTRRFIDDLLCFGTKPPPESIYSMGYKQTNACVGDATFLGIRIRHEVSGASGRRYMRLSVLDKAKAYPYRPLAYTSVLSTAPSNFGSSILIGALVRNGRIANNIYDFKTEMNNTNDVKLPPFFGPPDHLLRLAAVVVHMGEDTASGHYVTYVAQDTGWILFDDLHVTSVDDIPWGDVYLAAFVRIPRNAHDMTVRAPSPSMMIGWVAFLRTLFNEEEWRDVSRSLRGLPDDTTLLTLERLPMWALPVRVPSPELYRRVQDLVRARDQSSPALVSPVTPVEKRSTSQRRALKRALEDVPLMQPALA